MNQNIIIHNVDVPLLESECLALSMVLNREDLREVEREAIECILDTLAEAVPLEHIGKYKKMYEDLKAEFEQYKKESIKWSVEDFLTYDHEDYTITREQAQNALEAMIKNHDSCLGVNWDDISYYITQFGTPKDTAL